MADYWTVTEGEPLDGALHHWVLTPTLPSWCAAVTGLEDMPIVVRVDFWDAIAVLKARHGLTYWCMGSRSWEGGVVHVVVGDPSSDTTVKFEMGPAPDTSEAPDGDEKGDGNG